MRTFSNSKSRFFSKIFDRGWSQVANFLVMNHDYNDDVEDILVKF